jgi:hypothetical protein
MLWQDATKPALGRAWQIARNKALAQPLHRTGFLVSFHEKNTWYVSFTCTHTCLRCGIFCWIWKVLPGTPDILGCHCTSCTESTAPALGFPPRDRPTHPARGHHTHSERDNQTHATGVNHIYTARDDHTHTTRDNHTHRRHETTPTQHEKIIFKQHETTTPKLETTTTPRLQETATPTQRKTTTTK